MRRALEALVTREAAEQRGLVCVAWVAAPVLVILGRRNFLVSHFYEHQWTAQALIPGVVLLLTWALALDAVTRDAQSPTGERLETLPVGRWSWLLAKLVWLVACALGLLAWTYLAEAVAAYLAGGMPAAVDLLASDVRLGWRLAVAAWGSVLVLGLGLVLRRPWLAAAATVACAAGLVGLLRALEDTLRSLPEVLPLWLILFAWPVAWLVAAAWHYAPGFSLPREGLARAGTFLASSLLLAGAVGLVHAAGAARVSEPVFGQAPIARCEVSPDGRTLTACVPHRFPTLLGSRAREQRTWILDARSGELLARLPRGLRPLVTDAGSWLEDGRLRLYDERDLQRLYAWDPASGSIEALPEEPLQLLAPYHFRRVEGGFEVLERASGRTYQAASGPWSRLSVNPGWAYSVGPRGEILRHEFLQGSETVLQRVEPELGQPSPLIQEHPGGGQLYVSLDDPGGGLYLDSHTGLLLARLPAGWHHAGWLHGEQRFAVAQRDDSTERLLVGPSGLQKLDLAGYGRLHELGSDELLFADGRGLAVVDLEGRTLRELYNPD